MNTQTIIKQLEKALECKDDKELRLRIEVLADVMKESVPIVQPQPIQPVQSIQPAKITGKKGNQVKGAGSITSFDSEQISYTRPAGT